MRFLNFVLVALVIFTLANQTKADNLNNGILNITLRDDNGAIDDVVFDGINFFQPGTPVSNFGFQNNTSTVTFEINDTNGGTDIAVNDLGTTFTGTYTGGGTNLDFQRSYSLVPGQNVLQVTTDITNTGLDVTFSYFDTFDPDQGQTITGNLNTFNDVFNLSTGRVGQARIEGPGANDDYTVLVGSYDARATIAAGGPFQINDGPTLNGFFAAPVDGNDVFSDNGIHIGLRDFLGAGQTTSFTYYLSLGIDPASAQAGFTAVPEPSTYALLGLAAFAGLFFYRRRNLQVA